MNEDKATRYHRIGRRVRLLSAGCSLVLLTGLLASGGSLALRDWSRAAVSGMGGGEAIGPLLDVAVYVFVVAVLAELVGLPLSFYRGYVLEHRYSLSTESAGHWWRDHAKAGLLGLVLGEVAAVLIYGALTLWPRDWWIVAGAGYSLISIWLANLAPILLLPLFYRFKPLDRTPLRDRLTELAGKAGTPVVGAYEWMLSDRTRKANAALAGLGRSRRILLSDTLLTQYSDEEIEVILAHELAHHVHRDIWAGLAYDTGLTFVGFYAAHCALQEAVRSLGLRGSADPAGLPVLLLTGGALTLIFRPLLNAVSRAHERRADRFALKLTRNPGAFISAMRRLGQQNLAEEDPSRLVQAFFYTHPPIKERLRAAQDWSAATAR